MCGGLEGAAGAGAHVDCRIEMKAPAEIMMARALERIAHEHGSDRAIQHEGATATDRVRQTLIAGVTSGERVATRRLTPFDAQRPSVVVQLPQRIGRYKSIQLLIVDLHDVVTRGAAKLVPPFARGGVDEGAAIGDEIDAAHEQLEAEDVVVSVAAAAAHADVAAVDEHVRARAAQDEESSIEKRARRVIGRLNRQRIEPLQRIETRQPE